MHVGNEGLWAMGVSGSWKKILPFDLCDFHVVLTKPRDPFPGGV
jgi:hypothetical protein